jgi:hypothetical protein
MRKGCFVFLNGNATNPGSRVPDARRRVEAHKSQSERKGGQFVANSSAAKRRPQRTLAHSNSEYQLGRSRTCKAAKNTPEIFENIICDQRAGLRETQGICSKQGSRSQRVDRCDYHRILFPATRQSLIKSLPGVIYEPTLSNSIFSSFNFSSVNST